MELAKGTRLNLSAGLASVTVALVLVIVKLWALGQTGALSVAASLADSAMDLMVSLGAAAAILYAARPADEDHAFGHTSVEDLSALAQAVFVLVSAGVIGWAAVARLLSPAPVALQAEGAGMVAMAVSVALTLGLVLWQGRVARATGNRVVAADRLHYLGDLLPNLGALLSLAVSARFGVGSVDSVVALGAAGMLAVGALRIGSGAWDALMDRRADPAVIAGIERIAAGWPGVHGFHDLKTRTAGSRVFVNLHIELDGDQPLRQAHDIGAGLRRAIIAAYPQADVIIHKDVAKLTQAITENSASPRVKLSKLRDIGWKLWDPIRLLPSEDFYPGKWNEDDYKSFADEYDPYLISAASQLRSGASKADVVNYLVKIETEHICLGDSTTTRERAEAVVSAILAEQDLWTFPDSQGRFS